MANYVNTYNCTFSASATSAAVEIDPRDQIVAIRVPADFAGTSITLTPSYDGGTTFETAKDVGNNDVAITHTTLTANVHNVDQSEWDTFNVFKLVSSASESTTLTILTKTRT